MSQHFVSVIFCHFCIFLEYPNALLPLSSQLINITDQYMTLMADNGDIREDLRVPESEVGKEIGTKFDQGDDFMASVKSLIPLIPCWTRKVTAGHCN